MDLKIDRITGVPRGKCQTRPWFYGQALKIESEMATVNAGELRPAPSTQHSTRRTAAVSVHSLLSDRASFDAIVPELSKSYRVIVPELPGFGRSEAVSGGLAAVADRMAEAVKDATGGEDAIVLGNGYGGFVALQTAIRHPGIATRLVLADCGAAFPNRGVSSFATWQRLRRPRDWQPSRTWRCVVCLRRISRKPIPT